MFLENYGICREKRVKDRVCLNRVNEDIRMGGCKITKETYKAAQITIGSVNMKTADK